MLHFIVNGISGNGNGAHVADKIKAYLNGKKVAFKMHYTEYHLHAEELARSISRSDDCDGVIAVGGDGTFNEVLCGIDTRVPLGVIPSGSGNDFMRTFAPGKTLEQLLDSIISRRTRKIDYIEVNNRRSINSVGTGMDVDILMRTTKYRKFLSGKLSYYAALIATLFNLKFRDFEFSVDGNAPVKKKCLILTVANGKYFGGGMPVSLLSEIDDGVLDVVLIKKLPVFAIPKTLIKFLNGTVREVKQYVEEYKCRSFECAITPDSEIQLDGEIHNMPTFVCKIHHGELTVFE